MLSTPRNVKQNSLQKPYSTRSQLVNLNGMITASQAAAAKLMLNRRQNGHVQFGEPL